jgi:hypothetical protein
VIVGFRHDLPSQQDILNRVENMLADDWLEDALKLDIPGANDEGGQWSGGRCEKRIKSS